MAKNQSVVRVGAFGILLTGVSACCLAVPLGAWADEPAPPKTPQSAAQKPKAVLGKVVVTDEFNNPVPELKPVKAETTEQKKHAEALAFFMSGRLKQEQSRFTEALSDYQAAIKVEPNAVEVYRELVPLAFALNDTEKGLQYAQKAIELDPQNLEILKILAQQLHEQQKLEKAAEYLERAIKSPQLKHDTSAYVMLELQLAALCLEMRKIDKAADAYAIVFDARRNPAKYALDFQTRSALERENLARYEAMGEIFLAAGRTAQAIQAFEESIQGHGGKPGAISFNLAQAYFKSKNYDSALKHLQTYLDAQLQGRGRRPYELLREILKATGKDAEFLHRIEDLAKSDNRNSTLQYFLADQYIAADRLKEAEKIITEVLKETGNPEGYVTLAALYRKEKKPEELLGALSKAFQGQRGLERLDALLGNIQQDVPFIDSLIEAGRKLKSSGKGKFDFFTAYLVGRMAAKAQRTDAAVEFYNYAMQSRRDAAPKLADELCKHLVLAKRYNEAAEILKKVLAEPLFPSGNEGDQVRVELLALLSRAQELGGKTQPALASIREAQKLDNDEEWIYWEAWVYSHSHQWDEAIRRYADLIQRSKNKEFARKCQYTLSNCYVQKGDIPTGERILEEILVQEPKDPSVNNDLGYLYADQGKNLPRAEGMIRIALNAEPDNPAYLDSMGWVLFKLGRLEEARKLLEKAVNTPGGGDGTIAEHLGDCYSKLNANEKAQELWKRALKESKEDSFPDKKLILRLEEKTGSAAKK
ncbi:MAG TPA: tetratricopeptide repeat protein [Planctomycetaceae bacterium]|jgi:tetratricopeptide (TPR) repeat protein|nr:tetratricopeptide repeat protein [Planctomycetaceae bacterium]